MWIITLFCPPKLLFSVTTVEHFKVIYYNIANWFSSYHFLWRLKKIVNTLSSLHALVFMVHFSITTLVSFLSRSNWLITVFPKTNPITNTLLYCTSFGTFRIKILIRCFHKLQICSKSCRVSCEVRKYS